MPSSHRRGGATEPITKIIGVKSTNYHFKSTSKQRICIGFSKIYRIGRNKYMQLCPYHPAWCLLCNQAEETIQQLLLVS